MVVSTVANMFLTLFQANFDTCEQFDYDNASLTILPTIWRLGFRFHKQKAIELFQFFTSNSTFPLKTSTSSELYFHAPYTYEIGMWVNFLFCPLSAINGATPLWFWIHFWVCRVNFHVQLYGWHHHSTEFYFHRSRRLPNHAKLKH